MKNVHRPGDKKSFIRMVTEKDFARFEAGLVHPVFSTFALGRDAEWTCRLFVLDMLEEGEEGIGTFLNIRHETPAFEGSEVKFTGKLLSLEENVIVCSFEAHVNERLIADGKTGQKIVLKKNLELYFEKIKKY